MEEDGHLIRIEWSDHTYEPWSMWEFSVCESVEKI